LSPSVFQTVAAAESGAPLALKGATIFYSTGAPLTEGIILVRGERIAAIALREQVSLPDDAEIIDVIGVSERYCEALTQNIQLSDFEHRRGDPAVIASLDDLSEGFPRYRRPKALPDNGTSLKTWHAYMPRASRWRQAAMPVT